MQIVWLDAFHGGSHAAVSQGYARHSHYDVTLLTLPIDGGWRWRMRGAALSFARMLQNRPELRHADLLVVTDMLDLATLLGLLRQQYAHMPVALYMHENQLTYPLPAERKPDLSLPWINYTAALAADAVLFNSDFHRRAFLAALPGLPGRFHDYRELDSIPLIEDKARVLHPGLELSGFDNATPVARTHPPTILWNSRWEYDKAPAAFFAALHELDARGIDFQLIAAGEHIDPNEPSFVAAREWIAPRCRWWGYAPDPASYRSLLHQADIVVSTAIQEFFGIAVLEAMAAGCVPVLPNRLSYPELLPAPLHADCLYAEGALVERLIATLTQLPALRQHNFPAIAAQFDWRRQVAHFDRTFEEIVRHHA